MNILKLLGVVVGIHVVAYLVIAQPGCRSTATKPAPASTAIAPAAQPVPPGELQSSGELSPISLNLPLAQAPAGDRFAPTRPGTAAAAAESTPAKTYTVRKGDNLTKIAAAQRVSGGWRAIYNANRATIGANPNRILPGMVLVLP